MKKLYLVALGQTINRDVAIARLSRESGYGPWFYSIPNTFCIYSSGKAMDLFNLLHDPTDVKENLFVTEVPANSTGWLPKAHCELMKMNAIVHSYNLSFRGYWVDGQLSGMPEASGIYCVYACSVLPDLKLSITDLLYIGKEDNLRARHMNHERHEEWKRYLRQGETLCFSCAELPSQSLAVCEAALIFKHKPIGNAELKESFCRSATQVKTSGANLYLSPDFTVYKTL